jgi:uncharacterized protein
VEPLDAVAIVAAGAFAGTINAIVGSGSLVTFPTLLALGYPPLTANISNNIGLVAGGVTAVHGYRRELAGQRGRLVRLAPMSLLGAVAGALLLLRLPAEAFKAIVPVLVAAAVVLVLLQPRIAARVARRQGTDQELPAGAERPEVPAGPVAMAGVFGAGVYGGYFGAAQGVILVGLLGSVLAERVQRANALKNVLSLVVNFVAALTFTVVAPQRVDWAVVALISVGSLLGGSGGAWVGRRLKPAVLRAVIATIGVLAIVQLLTS